MRDWMRQSGRWVGLLGTALALPACDTTLATGLDDGTAQRALQALDEGAIGATRSEETPDGHAPRFRIEVAPDDVAQAVSILEHKALLGSRDPNLDTLRAEPALIPTRSEESSRRAAALALSLSQTLEALPGVARAHVQLWLPVTPAFAGATLGGTPTASVLIETQNESGHADRSTVQRLVAGAVPDLAADAVSVVEVQRPRGAARARTLTRIGPITVTRSSAPVLLTTLALGLLTQTALALLLFLVLRRTRRENPKR